MRNGCIYLAVWVCVGAQSALADTNGISVAPDGHTRPIVSGDATTLSTNNVSPGDSHIFEGCVISQPSSNVICVFESFGGDPPLFPAQRPVIFGLRSETNYNYEIFMLAPEYGYKLVATSAEGVAVRPTKLGARYGVKFDKVKVGDNDALDWTSDGTYNGGRPFWTVAPQQVPALSRKLPPPDQLFVLEKPGKYTVSVTVQVILRPQTPGSTNRYIARFPPVNLEIVK